MQNAIAYSALEGNDGLVFGDTGIRAMFDDAGELGKALGNNPSAFFDETFGGGLLSSGTTIKQALANLLVQYAGALAIAKVSQAEGGETHGVDVLKGILALSNGDKVLSVDLSNKLWGEALGALTAPIDAAELREAYFDRVSAQLADAYSWFGVNSIDELAQQVWGASDARVIDRLGILTKDTPGGTFTIAPRSYAAAPVRGRADNDTAGAFDGMWIAA
jgi:hypothetical protein